jgi:hypothetical protein
MGSDLEEAAAFLPCCGSAGFFFSTMAAAAPTSASGRSWHSAAMGD